MSNKNKQKTKYNWESKNSVSTVKPISAVDVVVPVVEEKTVPAIDPIPEKPKFEYKILAFRNDYVYLQNEVSKHLNDGWELVGGLSTSMNVSPYESVTIFSQALIRKG
jgi:hypothetical protein